MKFLMRVMLNFWVLLSLVACASSPATNFFRLTSNYEATETFSNAYTFQVNPIRLPETLRQKYVLSLGEHDSVLIKSNSHLWSSDLEEMFLDATVQGIKQHFPHASVFAFPAPYQIPAQFNITIVVEEFVGRLGGESMLAVQWLVLDQSHSVLVNHSAKLSSFAENNSYLAYVNALNNLLEQLNIEISSEISRLQL